MLRDVSATGSKSRTDEGWQEREAKVKEKVGVCWTRGGREEAMNVRVRKGIRFQPMSDTEVSLE